MHLQQSQLHTGLLQSHRDASLAAEQWSCQAAESSCLAHWQQSIKLQLWSECWIEQLGKQQQQQQEGMQIQINSECNQQQRCNWSNDQQRLALAWFHGQLYFFIVWQNFMRYVKQNRFHEQSGEGGCLRCAGFPSGGRREDARVAGSGIGQSTQPIPARPAYNLQAATTYLLGSTTCRSRGLRKFKVAELVRWRSSLDLQQLRWGLAKRAAYHEYCEQSPLPKLHLSTTQYNKVEEQAQWQTTQPCVCALCAMRVHLLAQKKLWLLAPTTHHRSSMHLGPSRQVLACEINLSISRRKSFNPGNP